jgi:hypothetical protein
MEHECELLAHSGVNQTGFCSDAAASADAEYISAGQNSDRNVWRWYVRAAPTTGLAVSRGGATAPLAAVRLGFLAAASRCAGHLSASRLDFLGMVSLIAAERRFRPSKKYEPSTHRMAVTLLGLGAGATVSPALWIASFSPSSAVKPGQGQIALSGLIVQFADIHDKSMPRGNALLLTHASVERGKRCKPDCQLGVCLSAVIPAFAEPEPGISMSGARSADVRIWTGPADTTEALF